MIREVLLGGTVAICTLFFGMKRFDVTWLGKLATFLLMFAFPGFMLGLDRHFRSPPLSVRVVDARNSGARAELLHGVHVHPDHPCQSARRPQHCPLVCGAMTVPAHLLYSTDHEWIAIDGTRARIGITDYAQDALGDVVFVQAPMVGASVQAGDSFSEVESTKSVSDIYAPVSGTVVAVNDGSRQRPRSVELRSVRRRMDLRDRDEQPCRRRSPARRRWLSSSHRRLVSF